MKKATKRIPTQPTPLVPSKQWLTLTQALGHTPPFPSTDRVVINADQIIKLTALVQDLPQSGNTSITFVGGLMVSVVETLDTIIGMLP